MTLPPLLASVVLGCVRPSAQTVQTAGLGPTYSVDELAVARESTKSWLNITEFEPGERISASVVETCRSGQSPVVLQSAEAEGVWLCSTQSDAYPSSSVYVLQADGWGHAATRRPDRTWATYETKIEVPHSVSVGMTWANTHGAGSEYNIRSCQVVPTPYCDDGIATECTTRGTNRVVFLRQHYCSGLGWVGHEAVVAVEYGRTMFDWSEQVRIDGVEAPQVEWSERPLPDRTELLDQVLPAPASK